MTDKPTAGWIYLEKWACLWPISLLDAGFALAAHHRSNGLKAGLRDASVEVAES